MWGGGVKVCGEGGLDCVGRGVRLCGERGLDCVGRGG